MSEQNKNSRVPKGRELMWFINNYFKSSVNAEQLYTYRDLEKVEMYRTQENEFGLVDLEDFVARWEYTLSGLRYDNPPEMVTALFFDQVRNCADMREA